ncbi:hypothetical protein Dimus_018851, partial [Dionaea muscipula]
MCALVPRPIEDLREDVFCVSKFKLCEQLLIDPALLGSSCDSPPPKTPILKVLETKNYAFSINGGSMGSPSPSFSR